MSVESILAAVEGADLLEPSDIDGIDDIFEQAEEARHRLSHAFLAACDVENVFLGAGVAKSKAYWGWEAVIHSDSEAYAATIDMCFEDARCTYTVTVVQPLADPTAEASVRVVKWITEGTCNATIAVATVFAAFHQLLLEVAYQ